MILLLEVVIDDGEVVKEDGHQVGAIEVIVAVTRYILFDKRHTVEIAQEVRAPDFGWINTLVAQFAEEAAIAVVDSIGDTAEVSDVVIGGTSVDMVDGHTGRNVLVTPCDIDCMGRKDMFIESEGIPELQVLSTAMRIVFSILNPHSIFQHFPSVGIDTHTDHPALAVVGVEGDVILGVRADIGDPHVVKEEGRAHQIRLADDFKTAFSQAILIRNFIHKHRQSGESLSRLAMQKYIRKKHPVNGVPKLCRLCQNSANYAKSQPILCQYSA